MHLNEVQKSIRDQILFKDSMSDYEVTKCYCGVEPEKDILIAEVDRHGLPCRNVICLNCGLIRISPRWKEVRYQAFYENEYRNLYNPIGDSKETFVRKKAKTPTVQRFGTWLKAAVERYGTADTRKITVLEIGAGGGWNISKLPSEWTKIGYDVDLEYLSLGERLFGLDMRFGLLTDALKDVPQADVIILSHVVEHFMDPVVALESIAANMRPPALLLIEVPGIFRIHYTSFDPMTYLQNAHTFTFCAQTLTEILHRAGLYVLSSDQKCRVICKRSESFEES